jgi:hypothetical protein
VDNVVPQVKLEDEATTGEGDAYETQSERSEGATTWEDRVRQEAAELSDKKKKLEHFIRNDPKFLALPEHQQRLLNKQHEVMDYYLAILGARIAGAVIS